jgi:hypothetical protein
MYVCRVFVLTVYPLSPLSAVLSLSIYLSIYLSICLSVYLSIYISLFLFLYLSLSLSISLSLSLSGTNVLLWPVVAILLCLVVLTLGFKFNVVIFVMNLR